ncbi:MAG TPA: DCC1-like thiol-disulfide oxidoreductase family protein [Actinocrinis sp.]|nr:DCC1-like thiol-disulfide oxidoreductase family protein [Actinocrinis sp.]
MLPVSMLTVLYDPHCPLCRSIRRWLERQPVLVPLRFVPAASPEARELYPQLNHMATLDEITVLADTGQIYTGPAAWITVLWALRRYRATAHRLATPLGLPFARGAVLAAARIRAAAKGGHGACDGDCAALLG